MRLNIELYIATCPFCKRVNVMISTIESKDILDCCDHFYDWEDSNDGTTTMFFDSPNVENDIHVRAIKVIKSIQIEYDPS